MIEHATNECVCEGKKCGKCGVMKCILSFNYQDRSKGILKSICKVCQSAYRKKYYQDHAEDAKANWLSYYYSHIEQCRGSYKSWVARNQESQRSRWKLYRQNHVEENKAYGRRYRLLNASKIKQRNTRDKDVIYQRTANWRKMNPDRAAFQSKRRRVRHANAQGNFTYSQWLSLKSQYDYRCVRCGRREPDIKLTVDHIIPLSKGGTHSVDNIQPLCLSCNSTKSTKIIDFRPQNP